MMTYKQALEYLAVINKFGMNFGLERIEKLLELMNHPERCFKVIHVTGTNGKGSTSAMLASILQAAGIKTALYTSPHLWEYTERMVVNGHQISRDAFAAAIEHTTDIVTEMVTNGWEHPTEFEILTAAAFDYFATAGVEYAVVEVGMGGLLDSTNVVMPEVAIITNVTLEHTDRLGKTVVEIAHQKAGIIKQNTAVVTAAKGDALAVIQATAVAKAAPLFVLGQDFFSNSTSVDGLQQDVMIETSQHDNLGEFTVNLLGRHQVENSAVAVMAALVLAEGESRITLAAIRAGLENVQWPGRFEVLDRHPTVIIDGAHNPDGARVLRETLDDIFPGKEIVFLLGILADKDVAGITATLVRCQDDAVIVRPLSDRAADPAEIVGNLAAKRIELAETIDQGYAKACSLAGKDGVVCVAGSLYLIGPARKVIYKSRT